MKIKAKIVHVVSSDRKALKPEKTIICHCAVVAHKKRALRAMVRSLYDVIMPFCCCAVMFDIRMFSAYYDVLCLLHVP